MNWFKTDDIRIQDIEPLISPAILIKDYPATTEIAKMVATTRKNAENIISGHDDRLLVVVGPCSIHDPQAAVDYASRLKEQMARFEKDLVIIMRVYFEKPRTTVGWKGLINDPFMNHTFDINRGLHMARGLLLRLGDMGSRGAPSARAPRKARYTVNWLPGFPCLWDSRMAPAAACKSL